MEPRCPACPKKYLPIAGSGPVPCEILCLGERPGKQENIKQAVFVGPTGEELNQTYLPLAGLRRESVRIENVVRCWEDNNKTPSPELVESCSRHFLPRTLSRVQPSILILMGGSACRIIDPDPNTPRLRLETHHGLPRWGSVLDGEWEGWIWPMYHPASGLHDTKNMTALLQDFARFAEWREGEWEAPEPRQGETDYQLARSARDVDQYMFNVCGLAGAVKIGMDTEDHGGIPWSVQWSGRAGTGRLIQAGNRRALDRLAKHIYDCGTVSIFHFAAHDLDVLDKMGMAVGEIRDTMQESYHQGDLPQALKPLAHRLLGANMRSWEDVVKPASLAALQSWLESAYALAVDNLTDRVRKRLKTKIKFEDKPSAIESISRHVLSHMADLEADYDPWEAWGRFCVEGLRGKKPETWELEYLTGEIGPIPILGIANAKFEDALNYATSDADHTLQVADALEQRRQGKRYEIYEGDRDQ